MGVCRMFCFCGRATEYAHCCAPFHQGLDQPAHPEQLMRARFSAYVLKDVNYIARTYHPSQQSINASAEISQFATQARFLSLKVLDLAGAESLKPENGVRWSEVPAAEQIGYVHFIATFLLGERLETLEELSRFVMDHGVWSYLDGQLYTHPVQKPGRNDPCPCGSGRKFKQCQSHWLNGRPVQAA